MKQAYLISDGETVTPTGIRRDVNVLIQDGRIRIDDSRQAIEAVERINAAGCLVLPGFTDIHTHGAKLFSFTGGRYDPTIGDFRRSRALFQEGLSELARFWASHGLTTVYPGLWATIIENLTESLAYLRDYMDSDRNGSEGARLAGGMLEGSFFNPRMAGAQNPQFALQPSLETFERINAAGAIRLVNVVPDFGEPSFELTRKLTERGIAVGAGHTDATVEQFDQAVRCGLRYAIHFTNGPTGSSYKPFNGGGVIEAVLRNDRVYAELIADGYHVAPAYMRDIIHRKSVSKIMLVTDAMFATVAAGLSRFCLCGIEGEVSEDRRYIRVVGKKNTLFSSVLTMDVAFANMVSLLTTEMPGVWNSVHHAMNRDEAVCRAAGMCATNPHEMLGDSDLRGSIQGGKLADIVIGRLQGRPGGYEFQPSYVFVEGRLVYRA